MDMSKNVFDMKYRQQIESGEVKVVTRDGRPVRILNWDMQGRYPVLAVISVDQTNYEGDQSWQEERPFAFSLDGHRSGYLPNDKLDLFVVSDSQDDDADWCNPSEFDNGLNALLKKFEALDEEEVACGLAFYLRAVVGEKGAADMFGCSVSDGKRFIESLWRDASEEPVPGREIITRNAKGIKVYPNPKNSHTSWEFFRRIAKVDFWAYSDDLIPSE